MHEFFNRAAFGFFALFPILNPPAMAPVFMEMTSGVTDEERHRLAYLIGRNTIFLLLAALLIGGWFLKIFGISISVIRIAGGLLLFNTAWKMLNDQPTKPASSNPAPKASMLDKAFFPMTLPVTAGPGSLAITLSLVPADSEAGYAMATDYAAIMFSIILAATTVYLFYRYSEVFLKKLGQAGYNTISKLSAFILLAIGVQIVWDGISGLIKTI